MVETRTRVAVLGASGFIGTAVSRALARRPIRLRLVSRRPPPVPYDPVADVEIRSADLTRPGALAAAVSDADVVIHLAAHSWRAADEATVGERVNVGLVRDLVSVCRAGRGNPFVVFAGTGLNGDDHIDRVPSGPRSAYCTQKLTAERTLELATRDGVLRAVTLRLPPVFGYEPGTRPNIVETMARKALDGDDLTLWNDGTVRRDLVHVDDVTAAFMDTLDHLDALTGTYWPVGTGRGAPLGKVFAEIAQVVADLTDQPAVAVTCVPPPANSLSTDRLDVDIDPARFHAVTGWRPRLSLRDGVISTVAALTGELVETAGAR
ncbi:NAD-dependent epimerase/dehydratase family protein [Actinophytocola glycyrrhizae]|uniref:NAD-dependent epimerase/dehydratase family protein n=1 Tax=Actinophytocola glycyrrhizae TaxID=2044873 RepID=A0ABV9RVC7_9PSEU